MSKILVLILVCVARFQDVVVADECPVNEQYHKCGPTCEPSCTRPEPQMCQEDCILAGCKCKPGFFRNSKGMCVTDCSTEPCGENMERHSCGIMEGCEPVCIRRGKKSPICVNRCVKNACQCKPGYIREFYGGMCISKQECSVRRGKPLENPTATKTQ
ncbi:trypsin Inhibitor like cysteine rich domain protein [Ancylostoma caninum]|uniref:Trypsin Inhibitor like cysteine rich domain protein n=1 Tax=Ancylostoma caninum TaxID=29170 RepID=A0A368GZR5_ANCCA|nr:trypsin Inhibitor like cysteine rich domain protein [Ancylostoma caninum]